MSTLKTTIAVIGLIVLWISAPARAVHYYVDPNGDDSTGLSWATAFHTIGQGIDASSPTIVEVNESTYYETIDFSGVGCTVTSTDPYNWDVVAATVIDANGDASAVSFHSSEEANSILTGFTVTGTNTLPAVAVVCIDSSPQITRCIIEDGPSGTQKYGVTCANSSPLISNCDIKDNTLDGVRCTALSAPTITRNQIRDNTGDGVNLTNSSAAVNNNWIYENGGAGIRDVNCPDANVCNNTIVSNSKYGIHNSGTLAQPTITNCIIWDCNDDMNNCTATYSCISDCCDASGTGNICGDGNNPDFIDAADDDYHLACGSPCIDKGGSGCGQTDIDGHPRVIGSSVDMGADEVGRVHNLDQDTWYVTIQAAINDAADGDTLVAIPCTYLETVDFNGVACTLTGTDPNDWDVVAATIIDAKCYYAHTVTFHSGEGAGSVLTGFTITGASSASSGAGVDCDDSSPQIARCIIKHAPCGTQLYGVACANSSPLITDCIIKDNKKHGVKCETGSAPTIVGCDITGNGTYPGGGYWAGIYSKDADPNIMDCFLKSNLLGIYCEDSAPNITDCEVLDSTADGIALKENSGPVAIEDCWVHDNGQTGIYLNTVNPAVVIRDCNISQNEWYGIYASACDEISISNCTISGNSDEDGIYVGTKDGTIEDCVITNNGGDGIEIYHNLHWTTSTVTGNRIENNGGDGIKSDGWGIYTSNISYNKIGGSTDHGISLDSTQSGCAADVYSNWIYDSGACGVKVKGSSSAELWNNTIVGSTAGGIDVDSGAQADVNSCIIWDCNDDMNNCTATYSCISDCNDAGGTGNICGPTNDPSFLDDANDDYHLDDDSPCIDKGDPNFEPGAGETDIDGDLRVMRRRVDMGADEFRRVHNLTQDKWYVYINDAIDEANDADVIAAYGDTYYEHVDFDGVSCTVRSTDPNDWAVVADTIIDANGEGGNVVTFSSSEDVNAVLSGFTITGGARGVYCSGSSPTVSKCLIKDNVCDANGGGMFNDNASPTVARCIFSRNTAAAYGGGIANYATTAGKTVTVTNSFFLLNDANAGGGISNYNDSNGTFTIDVTNCTVSENSASYGGGIYNRNADPTLTNCIFRHNNAPDDANDGAEIYNYDDAADPNFSYCDIEGDVNGTRCGGYDSVDGGNNISSDPCFVNMFDFSDITTAADTNTTIKVANAAVYEVNDVIEYDNDGTSRKVTGVNPGTDIVTFANDALDANSEPNKSIYNWGIDANDVDEDLHLMHDSPCIDAGDPCGDYSDQNDIDDEPRVADGDCDSNDIVDIGADEVYWPDCWGCPTQCHGDADCSGTVNFGDLFILRTAFGTEYGDPNYNACADFDKDGDINFGELYTLETYFGDPNLPSDCNCGGTWPPQ